MVRIPLLPIIGVAVLSYFLGRWSRPYKIVKIDKTNKTKEAEKK